MFCFCFCFSTQPIFLLAVDLVNDPYENLFDDSSGGGSHENNGNLVGHSPMSNSVARGRPNQNPPQRTSSLERTTSSGGANNHEIIRHAI
ncbi:hypothetical protein TIFTF001_009528 [Ficus carica]|uniref:Secreted protein n=1 Tax=Ficus carica TaxID=3494 RepID=A0AA88CZ20_FICCA|nr:hypothetical protein TIFTF001_009528 [Ficus carica]